MAAVPPVIPPDDLVREGNAAFERGAYETAIQFYEQAEERTTDPGLVAFNKAAALYRLGQYTQAEFHYRLCRQDATGARQACMLYGLANCLLQLASDRDAQRLQEAINLYQTCLAQPEADEALRADAAHNLELAKLLWLQARARRNERPDDQSPGSDSSRPPPMLDDLHRESLDRAMGTPNPKGEAVPVSPETGPDPIPNDQQSVPGVGNLQPVPDDEEPVSMSPEDAAQHLLRATKRIILESRLHRRHASKEPLKKIHDW